MSKHHSDAINMSKMALDKSEDQQIKNMAQRMINDQEKEITELQNMHKQIQADAPEAVNMKLPGMKPMNMEKLKKASGMDFDHEFLRMTIKHHKNGVEMAQDALKKANNQEVKDKAQQIIDKQNKEIAEMEQMLAEHKKH